MKKLLVSFVSLLICIIATASTLDGYVRDTDGNPIAGVQVSDGDAISYTDHEGYYCICSWKRHGYVFIEIPSNYEAPLDGVFPHFWEPLLPEEVDEVHNFTLKRVDNQEHVTLFLGDFHLCDRKSLKDVEQFRICASEIRERVASYREQGKSVYVMTLGDMTWDLYWDNSSGLKNCNFDLNAYKKFINEEMGDIPFFHTMGNHDNDYKAFNDWDAAIPYRQIIGPTYYSFNLGGFHYIVLDNVICTNKGTVTTRSNRFGFNEDEIDWLKADMCNVAPGTPVIVTLHEQVAKLATCDNGVLRDGVAEINAIIGDSHPIHYISADTHNINNYGKPGDHITEHNAGATCGNWWWSGRLTNGGYFPDTEKYKDSFFMMSRDGAPSGYTIYEMNGQSWKSLWKGYGVSEDVQFKVYDLNCVEINSRKYPGTGKFVDAIDSDAKEYANPSKDNTLLINIWNYDPSWTITVYEKETGKHLEVKEKPGTRDPLALVTYNAGRYHEGSGGGNTFKAVKSSHHIFCCQASAHDTTLEVTVTDGFGRIFTQEIIRPKAFTIDWN